MDKIGVLIVSKSLSSSAIADTLLRSEKYQPELYIVERQNNPFNLDRAKIHAVLPDLKIPEIVRFARKYSRKLAFGLTDTEDFVTAGGRDILEKETGVPMLCVTRRYAVEESKAKQRLLFSDIWPDANPRYAIFDSEKDGSGEKAIGTLKRLRREWGGVVIKPDAPARGAGVGVWGSDFKTEDEMVVFFRNVRSKGRVVVEERIDGEESSFQAFSDGRHFISAPLTRDYKRSLDGNKGKLTGGMGSYRAPTSWLPFLKQAEWEKMEREEEKAFNAWKGREPNLGLRGIVLYDAFMHTGKGFKILERNSRGGNTEQINLLTTLLDDFVDVCYRIIDGTLKSIRFQNRASVVTCAVPLDYGTPGVKRPKGEKIDLSKAFSLADKNDGDLRIFPMDVRRQNGSAYIGTSRSVAVVGIGKSVEAARQVCLEGIRSIHGAIRWRRDIGSKEDIRRSLDHLNNLKSTSAPELQKAQISSTC